MRSAGWDESQARAWVSERTEWVWKCWSSGESRRDCKESKCSGFSATRRTEDRGSCIGADGGGSEGEESDEGRREGGWGDANIMRVGCNLF